MSGRRPIWRVALAIGLLPFAGAALSYLLLDPVVLPRSGLGAVTRIVRLGEHLSRPLPDKTVVFLGSSIVREGIDAEIIEANAPGWHAENHALSGCSRLEMAILLPRLLAARPASIAIGISIEEGGGDVDIDKAYAYGRGGFPADWPAGIRRADIPRLGVAPWDALRASAHAQRMHFRSKPVTGLDDRVRRAVRPELRQVQFDDWRAPFEMIGSIGGSRLEHHLARVRAIVGPPRFAEGRRVLHERMRARGVRPVQIFLPVHPKLGLPERAAAWRKALAAEGVPLIDASTLLPAEEFADALHPNAKGRARLSRFVGKRLR